MVTSIEQVSFSRFDTLASQRDWHFCRAKFCLSQAAWYEYISGLKHLFVATTLSFPLVNSIVFFAHQFVMRFIFSSNSDDSFQIAMAERDIESAFLLYKKGGRRNVIDSTGLTLLDLAIIEKKDQIADQLLLDNVALAKKSEHATAYLERSIQKKRKQVVMKLVELDVKLPVCHAVSTGDKEIKPHIVPPYGVVSHQPCKFREKEQLLLRRGLKTSRKVLLLGKSGVGKTTLAQSYPGKKILKVDLVLLQSASQLLLADFNQQLRNSSEQIVILLEGVDQVEERFLKSFLRQTTHFLTIACSRSRTDALDAFQMVEVRDFSDLQVSQLISEHYPALNKSVIDYAIRSIKQKGGDGALFQQVFQLIKEAFLFLDTQYSEGCLRRQRGEDLCKAEKNELAWRKAKGQLDLLRRVGWNMEDKRAKTFVDQEQQCKNLCHLPLLFVENVTTEVIDHLCRPVRYPDDIKAFLQGRVVGQDHVVRQVSDQLRVIVKGWNHPRRPMGAMHFAGPTGTGKTKMAKSIAEFLQVRFVHVDMSKYREAHRDSTLVGTAAGYVGYQQGGLIQEEAKKGPMLLLLDEADKCDPRVLCNLLLHLLEEGEMRDPKSRQMISMSHVFVVLASNIGSEQISSAHKPGFASCCRRSIPSEKTMSQLIYPHLLQFAMNKKELLSRLTTLPFRPLYHNSSQRKVVELCLKEEREWIRKEFNVQLSWTTAVISHIVENADFRFGARAVKGIVEGKTRLFVASWCDSHRGSKAQLGYEKGYVVQELSMGGLT